MVENAPSSSASERRPSRLALRPVVWTPVATAWLETLEARADAEEKTPVPARSRRWRASTNWLANISG